MATKARQQYDADGISLQKESREFSIADEIQQKIDSIEEGAQVNTIETVKVNGTALVPDANKAVDIDVPEVIDNLYTVDSDNALSAKQGKLLYDYIQNIASRGRFLSNWNSATGLPMTNPSESPYPYKSGDYFVVSNVAGLGGTNYRPNGSSYVIGQASTVVETDGVDVSDFYFYDGTNWLLLKNSGRSLAVDSSLSTTSTNPVENRVITNALNDKANITDVLTKTNTTTYTPTTNYHPATKKYVDDNAIAFKAFPNTFDTTHTTQDFLDSIEAEHLPVGSAYLGQVSLSDMPSGVTIQGDVEVYVYPQNIIYAVMKSTDTSPYEWIVNSQYNRGWEPTNTDTTYTAGANVQISAQNVVSATDTTYVASDFDIKDLTDSTNLRTTWSGKQDELIAGTNIQIAADGKTISSTDTKYTAGTGISIDANNEISNTLPGAIVSATAPSNPTEGMVWYDTTEDSLKAYNGTSWETEGTKMVVLSYGHSTWQDFINAYNNNAIVYCRASSQSNPGSGSQTRLAFMAYVNNETTPTSVEFQYYRSRSDHNTQANQLDQVFVYTLTSASGGTWSVVERNTGAKAVAGTGINLTFGSGNMTISADTTTLATKTYVDEHDTVVSATAPSSPTEGMLWYDTTNDQLKVYDGTNWNVTGKEYNAGEGIEIGSVQSYAAIQGPAPSGFHVPSRNEWVDLCGIFGNTFVMESDATTMGTYLKMPMAGLRLYNTANAYYVGSSGNYWSSTPVNADDAGSLYFFSDGRSPLNGDYRAHGFSVRCFKDTPIIPTSSWTTLYDGSSIASGAGIFYNATDGLISISGDGQNWYTIMDKNLGATTVYNQGDALTDANCGYFFQWGNNYGFAHSGTVTTSSTKVDASNYGPGNYYNSSTFITGSYDRSSVQNDNLWGATTGIVTLDNAISNTGVLSVNGQTGDVTAGDMSYSDFNWMAKTGATITLSLASTITPSTNFTVNAPSTIKDGQTYILRVDNGATAYTMTLGTNISNPFGTDLTLTANGVDQFVFLAIGGQLELQPEGGGGGGGLQVAPNSPITGIKYVWYGTESDYSNLSQYYTDNPGDTEFHTF